MVALLVGCVDATEVDDITGGGRDASQADFGLPPPVDFGRGGPDVLLDDGGIPARGVGSVCDENLDCSSGFCIDTPDGRRCTNRCGSIDDCREGFRCGSVTNAEADVTFICVPNALCAPCDADDDCDGRFDRCLPIGTGTYCAADCRERGCPDGYQCEDVPGSGGQSERQCVPESGICGACLDEDGDGYGDGDACLGIDCDEGDPAVNEGGSEACNGADDDCDFRVDEELLAPPGTCLGLGECARAAPLCLQGAWDCRYPGTFEPDAEQTCDTLDNDCDGEADENFPFDRDPDNCGRCGNRCAFANAEGVCGEGRCSMGACLPGWVDLNGLAADGCEAECIFQSADDPPDLGNVDANCDGIDGDASRAIFVDTERGDDDVNQGSRFDPVRSITKGIEIAAARGYDVYISHGAYRETVHLVEGVNLYGGYDASEGWRRDAAVETVVQGEGMGLVGMSIIATTEVQRLHVRSADTEVPGQSSYAGYLVDSVGVVLRDSVFTSGRGGPGADGQPGSVGNNGSAGALGQDAQDSSNIF
ncbi:MAG: DUF1565 domain-containing protein, partial [Myxococcales bacterium]|nr:DUF1565 domain-containing protein [Myxococcales bacterium]